MISHFRLAYLKFFWYVWRACLIHTQVQWYASMVWCWDVTPYIRHQMLDSYSIQCLISLNDSINYVFPIMRLASSVPLSLSLPVSLEKYFFFLFIIWFQSMITHTRFFYNAGLVQFVYIMFTYTWTLIFTDSRSNKPDKYIFHLFIYVDHHHHCRTEFLYIVNRIFSLIARAKTRNANIYFIFEKNNLHPNLYIAKCTNRLTHFFLA